MTGRMFSLVVVRNNNGWLLYRASENEIAPHNYQVWHSWTATDERDLLELIKDRLEEMVAEQKDSPLK